jgi:hypothetical protein
VGTWIAAAKLDVPYFEPTVIRVVKIENDNCTLDVLINKAGNMRITIMLIDSDT